MDPEGTQPKPRRTLHNRLRASWEGWTGQTLSTVELRAQWATYELIFNDILARWSAKLAREAKMEKRRQARIAAETEPQASGLPVVAAPQGVKAQLRAHYAAMRFGGRLAELTSQKGNGYEHVPTDAQGD